jgi:lysophospholipid acyltransferase (LPLAT)-like uncharacterized protein
MLPCLRAFAKQDMRVLISSSRDGDFGADAANRLGYRVVRGSSSGGGAGALKRIADELSENGGWIAIVADGPRGPHGVCKPGAVWLSQHTGLPVVCVTARNRCGFTLGGWAKVRVPLPFASVELRLSKPFFPETTEEVEEVMKSKWLVVSG